MICFKDLDVIPLQILVAMETSKDGENLLDIYDQYAESYEGQTFKRNISLGKLDRVSGQPHSLRIFLAIPLQQWNAP